MTIVKIWFSIDTDMSIGIEGPDYSLFLLHDQVVNNDCFRDLSLNLLNFNEK